MAINGGNIKYSIGFSVDKSGLERLNDVLSNISYNASLPANNLNAGLKQAGNTANQLKEILSKTYNTELGTLNVAKFNQELKKSGLSLSSIKTQFQGVKDGATAYNLLSRSILNSNLQLKESNKLLNDMAHTFTQTARWTAVNAIINKITGSISSAVGYVEKLDKSLNDIRIVTGKSAEEMDKFALKANEAAKSLGKATTDYTEASLIYYQQGLSDQEVEARSEVTLKAANVTGQSTDEVSEQLTAVWNGYKVSAEEAELYVDKLAAVAATTASDLEELSVGMSKVASAANIMGVDVDQLNAQLATIVSVTREAPESIGNALKTIYGRMSTIQAGGIDEEDGTTLTSYSEKMNQFGINVLDANSNLRDMGDVIEEIGSKWNSFSREQQTGLAQAIGGIRQYSRVMALFDNWGMYTDALETSKDSLGTLQKQQDIYMESTNAKLKTLKATWEDLYSGLIKKDELDTGIEALTNLVQVFDNFIDSFGGGIKSISAFGIIVANIFNKQISTALTNAILKQDEYKQNLEILNAKKAAISIGTQNGDGSIENQAIQAGLEKQIIYAEKLEKLQVGLTTEQYNEGVEIQKKIGLLETEIQLEEKKIEKRKENLNFDDLKSNALNEVLKGKTNAIDALNNLGLDNDTLSSHTEEYENSKDNYINQKNVVKEEKIRLKNLKEELDYKKQNNLLSQEEEKNLNDRINQQENSLKQQQSSLSNRKQEYELAKKIYDEESLFYQAEEAYQKNAFKLDEQNNLENQFNNYLTQIGEIGTRTTAAVQTITGGLSSIAMGIGAINSLYQTWNDKNASFSDILTQSIMTLSISLPMLTKGIKDVIKGYNSLTFSVKILNSESVIQNALDAKKVKSVANLSNMELKNLAIKLKLINAEEEYTRKELITILTESKHGNVLDNVILKLKAKLGVEKLETKEALKQIAVEGLKKIALLAVVAAVTALIYAYKNYLKNLQEEAEIAKESADKHKELTDSLKEEKNTISDLRESYSDLYKQYQNNEISTEELRDKTYDLCAAHENQRLSVLALTEQYDALNEAIKDLESEENDKLIKSAEEDVANYEKAVNKGLYSFIKNDSEYGKSRIDSSYTTNKEIIDKYNLDTKTDYETGQTYSYVKTLDLYGMGKRSDEQEEFAKRLEELGIEFYNNDHIIMESFENVLVEHNDELYEILDDYDFKASKALREYADSQSDNIEGIKASKETRNQAKLDNSIYNNFGNKDNIKDINDYIDKIRAVKNELKDLGLEDSEIDAAIKSYTLAIDGLEDYAKDVEIAQYLLNDKKFYSNYDTLLKNLADDISHFSESEKSFIVLHPVLAKDYINNGGIEKLIEDNIDITNYEEAKSNTVSANQLMANFAKDGKFTDEDRASAKGLGIENAFALSEAELLQAIRDIYDTSLEETNNFYDNAYTRAEELATKVQEGGDNLLPFATDEVGMTGKTIANVTDNDFLNSLNDQFEQQGIEAADKYMAAFGAEFSSDTVLSDIDKLVEDQRENGKISEENMELYTKLTDILGKDYLPLLMKNRKAVSEYSDSLDETNDLIEKTIKLQEDWATKLAADKQIIDDTSAAIDSLQSAYKTMYSAMEEYNETGILSVDNVQSLLELEPQYLQYLDITNDKMTISTDSIKEQQSAYYDLLEAKYANYLQDQLNVLLDEKADPIEIQKIVRLYQYAEAQEAVNGSLDAFIANANAALEAGTNYDKEIQNMINTATNYQKILNSGKNSLDKDFNKSMGISSGSSSKKDKEEKEYDDEFDRYHDINNALKLIDNTLKDIERQQKHLYGRQLIQSLQMENAALDEQAAMYEQLAAAQAQEAGELQAQLALQGLAFDASGAITNYAAATAQALQEFNDKVKAYNAGLISETEYSAAEKRYNDFKEQLDRYDKLYYDEMQETQQKIKDIRDKQLENNFKAWETEITVKLDFAQMERQWNDFLKKAKDDFRLVFKDLNNEVDRILKNTRQLISGDGDIKINIDAINSIEHEIDTMMAGGSSNIFGSVSEAQESLKDYISNLQDAAEELHDLYESAWDALLDGIEQGADKLEDIMSAFERIDNELEFQGELINLLYGEKAYSMMDKLFKAQESSGFQQIRSLQQQVDLWTEELAKAEEGTQEWQDIYDNLNQAQEDLNNKVLEYIQLLKDDYANAIDDIMKKFETFVTNGSSFDRVSEQWDRISDKSEKYYDDIEGLYQIQKLANDIQESIAKTDNIKEQEKLQKLYDKEITYLREKENLTEYDIKAAEARYQIALKEIALEEAQNNKTSMKLMRNDEGNWSYQYMADEDAVGDSKQELLDAYQNLYDLAKEAYQENLESLQELQQKYLDSARELYLDDTITEEERQIRLSELRSYYLEEYKNLATENQLYRNDLESSGAALLWELYDQDLENYAAMNAQEQELLDALLENYADGYASIEEMVCDNYDNIGDKAEDVLSNILEEWTSAAQEIAEMWNADDGASLKDQVINATASIAAAADAYMNKVNEVATVVRRDFSEEGITGAIMVAENETMNLADATANACDDIQNSLSQYRDALYEVKAAWDDMIPSIEAAIEKAMEYLRLLQDVEIQAQQAMADVAAAQAAASRLGNSINQGTSSGNKTGNVFWSQADSIYANDPNYRGSTTYQGSTAFGTTATKTAKDTVTKEEIARILHHSVKYASGGYTGEWNGDGDPNVEDGKLAFLHQKELVLNESDTSNILKVVETVRNMKDNIVNGIGNLFNGARGINNISNSTDNSIGNTYNITAEISTPNGDVEEIKQAILDLPNYASQYAGR